MKNHFNIIKRPSLSKGGLLFVFLLFMLFQYTELQAQSKFGDSTGIGTITPAERLEIKGADPRILLSPTPWNTNTFGELRFGDANHYIRGVFGQGLVFHDQNGFRFQGMNNLSLDLNPSNWSQSGDYAEIKFGGADHAIRGVHSQGLVFHDQNGFKFQGANNLMLQLNPSNWSQSGDYAELRFGDDNHWIRGIHSQGMKFHDSGGFIFDGGDVGVGTDNPDGKLHVSGYEDTDNGKGAAITLSNTNPAGGGNWYFRVGANGTSTPLRGLSIANDYHYAMSINQMGNVGLGVMEPEADLHVKGSGDVFVNGTHVAIFENTSLTQGGDGIAIKLNQSANEIGAGNRFVSFMRSDNSLAGRIEGYQYDNSAIVGMINDLLYVLGIDGEQSVLDLTNPSGSIARDAVLDILNGSDLSFSQPTWSAGSLPSLSWGSLNPGSLPSLGWGSLFNHADLMKAVLPIDLMTDITNGSMNVSQVKSRIDQKGAAFKSYLSQNPAMLDLVTAGDPWGLALAAMSIELLAWAEDDGVSYASKGADYAEWLPKKDADEHFMFGQIVGVKDGKISKSTQNADQMMVISQNPIVLGNMIPKGEEANYEKVGFMGQVPVQVIGKVKTGDYIIASGLENGFGKAISPEDIKLEHFTKIVGRAWSDNELPMGVVNVAIGLKTNEWVSIIENQQNDIEEIKKQLAKSNAEKQALGQSFASLKAEVTVLSEGLNQLQKMKEATSNAKRTVTTEEKRP